MSQFCRNCGTQMDDNDHFCPRCGTKTKPIYAGTVPLPIDTDTAPLPVNPATPAEEPAPQPDVPSAIKEKYLSQKDNAEKKHPNFTALLKKPLFIAAIMAAFILIVGFSVLSATRSVYHEALTQYFDIIVAGKTENLESLAPDDVWKAMKEETGLRTAELIKIAEYNSMLWSDHYISEVGLNAKYSYTVESEEQISDRKLRELKEVLEDTYSINSDQINAGYKLEVIVTITGERKQTQNQWSLLAVEIDGKMYLLQVRDWNTMDVFFCAEDEYLCGV